MVFEYFIQHLNGYQNTIKQRFYSQCMAVHMPFKSLYISIVSSANKWSFMILLSLSIHKSTSLNNQPGSLYNHGKICINLLRSVLSMSSFLFWRDKRIHRKERKNDQGVNPSKLTGLSLKILNKGAKSHYCSYSIFVRLYTRVQMYKDPAVGSDKLCSKIRAWCFWASPLKTQRYAQNYAHDLLYASFNNSI